MTNPDLKVSGVRALADALGTSKTRAAELAKEPWFPPKGPDGSWDVRTVKKAYEDFREGRFAAPSPTVHAVAAPPAPGDGLNEDRLRQILETEDDPEKIAHAVMQLMARSIATSGLSVKHVVAMKMALEEARKGASGYLKIAQERGELVKRTVAKVVIGDVVQRAVRILERYEVELAARVEAWFGDEKFRAMTSEERARAIRAWAQAKTHDLRSTEAKEIEDLVAAEVKEQAG